MQRISNVARGALLLCAALSLAACATSGSKSGPQVALQTELVKVQTTRYAPIDPKLTAKPVLPAAPEPNGSQLPDCAPFCYSNKQLTDMLHTALTVLQQAYSQLDQIAAMSEQAVNTNPKP